MPNQPKTPNRAVRVGDEEWASFGEAASAAGTDRTKAINAFIRWYLRQPGAKIPDRPASPAPGGNRD